MNIIISGTNFWNPGDDFVRDGVVKVIENLFKNYRINFLFYNFNQDFFPHSKFDGIANTVAAGDIDKYADHIDAIVIAGLSAGNEISDLYNWIIKNNLCDRVYLIGAGYENTYVDKYIRLEPAATIFKNARVITGRTRKKPNFITDHNLPYHHIHCPAILSVPDVKHVPEDKQIEKIAFSIQLPHRIGISNHACTTAMHRLSMQILFGLYHDFEIEVIAHHKSEYFYFLELFKDIGLSVPVIFSSFYQEMYDVYPNYDFIISTRLHACLFGNGHGIPAVIINDTDRHTECVEGFPHSRWINSPDRFSEEFKEMRTWDLSAVADEAAKFKTKLLSQYREVLAKPFGVKCRTPDSSRTIKAPIQVRPQAEAADSGGIEADVVTTPAIPEACNLPAKDDFREDLTDRISTAVAYDVETKRRVLAALERLTKDHWLASNIKSYQRMITDKEPGFDAASFINWYAEHFKPTNYLEVGVRRGRSMAQVLTQSPGTKAFGFDMWIPDYGSDSAQGVQTVNPGPDFVRQEFRNLGIKDEPTLIKGNSHATLPKFWRDQDNPRQFDLIFVDGDHTYEGAKLDLDICFRHLAAGGALVFDDILHPSHPELKQLWEETKAQYPDCVCIEHPSGMGTGVVFKPPFDRLEHYLHQHTPSGLRGKQAEAAGTVVGRPAAESTELPIHFFTIVLNGEPFVRYHIGTFKRLPFKWHWHIVEGVADLKNDTAWSLNFGGRISAELHHNGLSNDGTTAYLDTLKKEFPENITVYRKPPGVFWDGKVEMVSAPLQNIREECLLWQVDADELWTSDQINAGRNMFLNNPNRTAAYYYNYFFVGPDLVTTTLDTYGNNTSYEWLRTWRFKPSYEWASHEPPKLCKPVENGNLIDIAEINPFKHSETKDRGLIFQHYAYATEAQLAFKEIYYGYKNAIKGWRVLQTQNKFPVSLKEYFTWVKDDAKVDTIASQNIVPLIESVSETDKDVEKARTEPNWFGEKCNRPGCKILFIRTDAIGDNILFMPTVEKFKHKYPKSQITILCQEHIAELYKNAPFIDSVITFDRQYALEDADYRSEVINKLRTEKYDFALNTVYSREPMNDFFSLASGAAETIAFNGNLCNISRDDRDKHNQRYSKIIPSHNENKAEVDIYIDFLHELGIDSEPWQPTIWLDKEDKVFADNILRSHHMDPDKTIVLFAGTQKESSIYQQYGVALSSVCCEKGFSVIALGSQKDYAINAESLGALNNIRTLNLSGKTTLLQAAALIKRCRLAVGADTGLAHIACTVGTQNVILLGGAHFGRFLPYSKLTSIVCLPLDCYGCDWQCLYSQAHCVRSVSPRVIAEAIRQTIEKGSNTPRVFAQTAFPKEATLETPKLKTLALDPGFYEAKVIPVEIHCDAKKTNDKIDFSPFTYSKKSHFDLFQDSDLDLYGVKIDKNNCDLKVYQDLLAYNFIILNIPKGSKILEIGGGESRVLNAIHADYECWNIDKMEGVGNGPTTTKSNNYRLVRDYMGSYSPELPDNYFDFVFSISALEHVEEKEDIFQNVCRDIDRVLKPGSYSLNLFDVLIRKDDVWSNGLLPYMFERYSTNNPLIPFDQLRNDADLYSMTEASYSRLWKPLTKKTFADFGRPISYNILWKKHADEQTDNKPLQSTMNIRNLIDKLKKDATFINSLPKISIITPSFNQGEFLEDCVVSVLEQSYPNLEYIIMDGGSTDGSVEIIKKYEDRLSHWQSQPDEGQYAAISEGFKRSTGEIMCWLNSDDKLHEKALFIVAYIFKTHGNVNWIMGRPTAWDQNGNLTTVLDPLPLWARTDYLAGNYGPPHIQQESTFWRRPLWEKAGSSIDTKMKYAGDLELWSRFFRYDHLYSVDALLGGFRSHSNQKTATNIEDYNREADKVIAREVGLVKKDETLPLAPNPISFAVDDRRGARLGDNNAGSIKRSAEEYLRKGEKSKALSCYSQLIKDNPHDKGAILCAGQLLVSQGKSDLARQIYLHYLNQNPSESEIEAGLKELGDRPEDKEVVNLIESENRNYTVSAIVSTYRSEEFMEECLQSLLGQSISKEIEIVVVDAASPENERKIVKSYQKRHSNITYIRTKDRIGVYTAWNIAIKHAKARYCISFSTNDALRKEACEILSGILDSNSDCMMVYGDTYLTHKPHETFKKHNHYDTYEWPDFRYEDLMSTCMVGPHPMWRKSIHEKIGYFGEHFIADGDQEFWLRIGEKYNCLHIKEFTGLQWITPDALSQKGQIPILEANYIHQLYRKKYEDRKKKLTH